MGFLNRNTTVTVKVPKVKFIRDYRGNVDWGLVASIAFSTLAFIVIAAFALGLTYKALLYIDRKPPTIRTVYVDKITAEEQAYIQQCKGANNGNSYGIPDTHTSPWTCTYAK